MNARAIQAQTMSARAIRAQMRERGEHTTIGAVSPGSPQRQREADDEAEAARKAAGVPGKINQTIEGERFSKTKNKNVKCDMAVNAITRNAPIGKHGEYVRPICEWPSAEEFPLTMWDSHDLKGFDGRKRKLQQMIKANLIKQEDAGAGEYQLSFASKCGIAMDRAFACLPSTTSVIVLTSGGGFEHAMLLFINGTNIWSCGYGFYGSADTRDAAWHENFAILLKDWIPCTKGKSESEQDAIAHKLETLQGALYTSDYLLPNYTQAANMVWVGFLDDGIKNRLEKYLDAVKIIQIKTTGGKGQNLTATNHMTLYVGDSYYQEAAGWTGRDLQGRIKMNCLKWVKHILGQDLKCGVLGEPSNCKKVNEEQWARLIDSNFLAGARESVDVVEAVQNELLRPDIPSTVGKGLQKLTQNPWIPTMLCGIGIGAACAPAAIGPTGCGALTGAACVGARAIAHRKLEEKMNQTPKSHKMTRTSGKKKNPGGGGRKTRRKRKKRRTRNKHKRRKKKRRRTRYKKKKHRRKRRTRR
jgi:hypothetical protein